MKRLTRSRTDRKICGVCGGLGEYFGIDPNVIRVGLAIATVISAGTGALIYLVSAVLIPEE